MSNAVCRQFAPADRRRFNRAPARRAKVFEGRGRQGGHAPRVSALMALALRFEGLLREGSFSGLSEIACRGHVTRARMTQVMNLLNLAPDIQEELLNLPEIQSSRGFLTERKLRPIASTPDWQVQRGMWDKLKEKNC